jgi:splicing suppressor protein 51
VAIAERFAIKHYINTGEPNCMLFTPVPRKTYIPLSTVPDWYTYFTLISSQPNISGRVSPDTLDPIPSPEDNLEELQDTSSFLKAATDKIGMMVTILAGLEAVFPDLKDKETLTLHIIGATAKELDALMLFEELLHVLPSLKSIHTSFIGLELPSPEDNEALASLPLDCCEPCIALNRKRSMTMYKGSYIEFMRAHRIFRAPDIAVLFHTGHSQESISDWLPTIRYLGTQASHASVFTCFNKMEMTEEIEGLKGAGARFLVDGEENKWRGRRPLLEVAEEEEGSKFHMNAYWYVVAPHLTATSNK